MRRLPLALALTLTLAPAWAVHAQAPLDLARAATLAVDVAAGVQSARLDLATAERDLARAVADPTTLRIPRLQADHAVARAATALRNAEASARDGAASAYTAALEADDRLALAEAALAIATTTREALTIQFEAGAATRLDVDRTEDDRRAAASDVADAVAARALAYDRLASLIGAERADLALARAPEPGPLLELEAYLVDLPANAQLQAADQQVALAEAQLAAVDNPLSSAPSDVAAARDRVEAARLQRDEQARSLTLLVRQAHNAARSAEARVRAAEAAAASAREEAGVQRVRFEAGSVSALALARTEQQALAQEQALAAARHGLLAAIRQLQLTLLGAR
jgi:outer membrane protein TolC